MTDKIVAIGLLSQGDLERLGSGFNRLFPVEDADIFSDLLTQLDQIEATPLGKSVVLSPTKKN